MHALFQERRYTDFLPIVLPTEERVEQMLTGTSHAPDEMVGKLRPTIGMEYWHFDVEKVAVNAVMAGAAPEHFPVLLALASSGDTGRQSSMSSMGNMVVVNGPIRHEIGMNSGIGALGPYNYANSAIGRAFGLLSQNLQGGSVPGETYDGSQGSNYSYNCITFAENEEASPWEPYHLQYGYDEGRERRHRLVHLGERLGRVPARVLAGEARGDDLRPRARNGVHARARPDRGPRVRRARPRDEGADRPVDPRERPDPAAPLLGPRHAQLVIHEEVEAGVEPFASYWKAPPDELIPVFEPDRINIVVAGGETNGHFSIFMGSPMRAKFRTNKGQKVAVSIDEWR